MQNSIMVPDGEDEEFINTTSSNSRPRIKKKSTLTKLKEKKQKELGSSVSLKEEGSSINIIETPQSINNASKPVASLHSNGDTQIIGLDPYSLSVKESSEDSGQSSKPKPKPRGRKQLSDVSSHNCNHKNHSVIETTDNKNTTHDISDVTTIQMLRNLKMGSDQLNSVGTAVAQSSFIPKPPSTPRTPRSNPRTPRGFVLAGKGEKRIREPGSSGDEPEIEEKKEKSNRINNLMKPTDTKEIVDVSDFESVDLLYSNDTVNVNGEKSSSSHGMQGQFTHKERSRDARNDICSQGDSHQANLGKPPINRNFTLTDSHNSIVNKGKKPSEVNEYSVQESSQYKSYKSINSPTRQLDKKPGSFMSESGMPLEKVSPSSSLCHILTNTEGNGGSSSNHDKADNALLVLSDLLLADTDTSSQFTQPMITSESPLKMQSLPSPPRMTRLDPISPRSHPPPLPDELSSRSLRTIYKIDSDVHPRSGMGHMGAGMDKSDSGTNSSGDRLSQKSFTSVSVLPVITTKEARSRTFLEGSITGGSSSVLGTYELDRYFPERKVNIFVGTWNMNELKDVMYSLDDFILPEKCDYVQDIYAIGTQENNMNKKEWEIKVQETLGPSHVMLHSVSLGSLHLAVYVRRDLIWFCSVPEDDVISLRAVTMVKTKGAIGICFTLFGTSYLFINCHLTSDRDNETSRKKNRLGDYYKVISEMKLPKLAENSSKSDVPTDVTAVFDCIFWFGDLNFRIERKRNAVERKVNQITSEEFPNFEALLAGDQLLNCMAEGKIFGGFQEGRINFHPTFKFDVDSNTYDSSAKNRVPSYTDRVMFRSKKKNDVTCVQYDTVMNIKSSDHRPVYGLYETAIKPGRDNMVYSLGHFNRSVYMEAIRRRTAAVQVKKKQSVVCAIQ